MPIPTLRRSLMFALSTTVTTLLAAACGGGEDGSNVTPGNGSPPGSNGVGSQPMLDPNGTGASGGNGGVTVITNVKQSENNEDFDGWEYSFKHYPTAEAVN
jgi:hypothetical protein